MRAGNTQKKKVNREMWQEIFLLFLARNCRDCFSSFVRDENKRGQGAVFSPIEMRKNSEWKKIGIACIKISWVFASLQLNEGFKPPFFLSYQSRRRLTELSNNNYSFGWVFGEVIVEVLPGQSSFRNMGLYGGFVVEEEGQSLKL